jgi:hypothetical protein
MEDVGMFYDHWVLFTAIWNTLWPCGKCYGYLVYFFPFRFVVPRKVWQPCVRSTLLRHRNGHTFSDKFCSNEVEVIFLLRFFSTAASFYRNHTEHDQQKKILQIGTKWSGLR